MNIPKTIRMPAPLCGIRFIVLTDGTVYENCLYERNKRLTADEYTAIFNHATLLLCGNIPDEGCRAAKKFDEAAF